MKALGNFISPLFTERDEKDGKRKLSLGRVAFWICFGIAVYIWIMGTGDITASHLQMLYITTTYNLMKKAQWFGSTTTTSTGTTIKSETYNQDPYDSPRLPESDGWK